MERRDSRDELGDLVAEHAREHLQEIAPYLRGIRDRSVIEHDMLLALAVLAARDRERFDVALLSRNPLLESVATGVQLDCMGEPPLVPVAKIRGSLQPLGFPHESFVRWRCYPQVRVGRYVADFILEQYSMLSNDRPLFVAIECDGHDFHERTKEQARHDRSRDRFFLTIGLAVLRFTGSEIAADANRCAEQVDTFLLETLRRQSQVPQR